MELIDKSALVVEIGKRQKEEVFYDRDGSFASWADQYHYSILESIKNLINTFDVKEVDLEQEIQQHLNDCLDIKFPTTDIKLIAKDVEYTARKFFELGIKSKGE